jgi:uncharacterized GH25 family protein
MRNFSRILAFVALLLSVSNSPAYALARQSNDSKSPSGSISGRVTLNGKPVPRVPVILTQNAFDGERKRVAKTTTDQDGRFRITNVPAGSFNLSAFAPAFVFDDRTSWGQDGKRMTISPGEVIEGVDVALKRGGVITGKVSDSTGQPVVEERVTLNSIDEPGRQGGDFDPMDWQSAQTDDRGVYRIFGVPEGRYIASVGEPPNQRSASVGRGNAYYPMTFHPGVTDGSKATVIELAAGAESTGVDIVLGCVEKGFTVKGRIVDAETGKPLSNILYGYGVYYEGTGIGAIGRFGDRSDPQGNFHLDGVPPNHYAVFVVTESDYYSDLTPFDVTAADVSGLEIKVRRGSSLTGVAVLEGSRDRDAAEKLAGLRIRAFILSTEPGSPFSNPSKIGPDGSFRITGLRPGKVRLSIGGYPPPKGFALTRVERDGVEQRDGSFEITAGEEVSSVRVTIAYGTAVVRGQLKITGRALPQGARFSVRLKRAVSESTRPDWWTEADDRNRFLFEDLPAGDYELTVTDYIDVPGAPASRLPEVKRRVTVSNDGEVEITIVIDSNAKDN